jgi:hypothetical protein
MPKIRVEYEVPEDDCIECIMFMPIQQNPYCQQFKRHLRIKKEGNKIIRCQPCIDAEVKEGE